MLHVPLVASVKFVETFGIYGVDAPVAEDALGEPVVDGAGGEPMVLEPAKVTCDVIVNNITMMVVILTIFKESNFILMMRKI